MPLFCSHHILQLVFYSANTSYQLSFNISLDRPGGVIEVWEAGFPFFFFIICCCYFFVLSQVSSVSTVNYLCTVLLVISVPVQQQRAWLQNCLQLISYYFFPFKWYSANRSDSSHQGKTDRKTNKLDSILENEAECWWTKRKWRIKVIPHSCATTANSHISPPEIVPKSDSAEKLVLFHSESLNIYVWIASKTD